MEGHQEMKIPTPHITAKAGDFAETVLMPGDPLRSRYIAENFLEGAVLVNDVRGVQGYTGYYKGKRVSVMASGMGMPSIGIYSYELFAFYGVENIIRIGSAGGISEKVKLRDIVFGLGSCTDSNYAAQFKLPGSFAPTADWTLLSAAVKEADKLGVSYHVGNLLASDLFYGDDPEATLSWGKMGVLAVEMESAALYMNAARLGKRALAICTISDHLKTGEAVSAEDRRSTFTQMMEVALNTALSMI